MTSQLKTRCETLSRSLALATAVALLIGQAARAQDVLDHSSLDALMGEAPPQASAPRRTGPANLGASPRPGLITTGSGEPTAETGLHDLATTGQDELVENGWDFNNPDSIPGFASKP